MAGGIVTNANQSAMYTRLQCRDATIGIDAVYYNPAGLTLLPNDGLFISLNNQTVWQTRTITTDYPYTNAKEYEGKIFAPFFPGFYAVYKKGSLAFSLGLNPIGGGGGGTYNKGLPSFEYLVSDLRPGLQSQGVTAYRADINFEGKVAYMGYQANISYKINDMISIAIGGRYVMAKESYSGSLKNVEVYNYAGGATWTRADIIMTGIANNARTAGTNTQGIINANAAYGGLTFAQAEGFGIINSGQRALLEGALTAFGGNTSMTINGADTVFDGAAALYSAKATGLGDQEVKYEKTATGFTPIVSVNIKPSDNLNIALKYEGNTKLEFENKTDKDFVPIAQFPDGAKARYDIPAQLTVGLTYRPIEKLFISTGIHYYFDKQANWEGREDSLKGNMTEYALGIEYTLSKKLLVSVGYLNVQSGAEGGYQTDLSYSMSSNTFGGGFAYQVTPYLEVNLAGSYTMYETGDKTFIHRIGGSGPPITVKETYDKDVLIVAVGLNFNLAAFKNK